MSRRLEDSEWIHVAERLPVGQSTKVQHSCGSSPALSIRSEAGRMSAHCYRCKAWGVRQRTHRPPKSSWEAPRGRYLPKSYAPLRDARPEQQAAVHAFVVHKGLDPNALPENAMYSPELGRLAFKLTPRGYAARALNPDTVPKWVTYDTGDSSNLFALGEYASPVLVLTEDTLSACKVHSATGHAAVSLMGTRLSQEFKAQLVGGLHWRPEIVLVFLDGDFAGEAGAVQAMRELRFLGLTALVVATPSGKDPKDLCIQTLRDLLNMDMLLQAGGNMCQTE